MNSFKTNLHKNWIVNLVIVFGIAATNAFAEERVVKYHETEIAGIPSGGQATIAIHATQEASETGAQPNRAKVLKKLRDDHTFIVWTAAETQTNINKAAKEVRDEISAERATKAEVATTKADILKAISDTVGKQLSAEQLQQIKTAISIEIKAEVKTELREELKAQLKTEIIAELRQQH